MREKTKGDLEDGLFTEAMTTIGEAKTCFAGFNRDETGSTGRGIQ